MCWLPSICQFLLCRLIQQHSSLTIFSQVDHIRAADLSFDDAASTDNNSFLRDLSSLPCPDAPAEAAACLTPCTASCVSKRKFQIDAAPEVSVWHHHALCMFAISALTNSCCSLVEGAAAATFATASARAPHIVRKCSGTCDPARSLSLTP